MTEKLKNTIKEEVLKLPKEAQEAISSLDWGNIAEEIGKKYLLDENEINDLQVETLLVLVGITNAEFYAINIENQINTSKDTATKIASEVFKKIFTPINDNIVKYIKKSDKVENGNTEQNLNFILSGGDYSVFLEVPPLLVEEGVGDGNSEENHLAFGTPPQKGGEEEEPVVPVFSLKKENFKK